MGAASGTAVCGVLGLTQGPGRPCCPHSASSPHSSLCDQGLLSDSVGVWPVPGGKTQALKSDRPCSGWALASQGRVLGKAGALSAPRAPQL